MVIYREQTQLTNQRAGELIGSLPLWDGDASLAGLVRAIVLERMDGDISVDKLAIKSRVYKLRYSSAYDTNVWEKDWDGALTVIECGNCYSDVIPPTDSKWTTFDGAPYYINKYLSKIARSKVFINTEEQRVVAAVSGNAPNKWIQALESMLWALLPWYFPEKTPEVIDFFKHLSVDNENWDSKEVADYVIDYINEVAKKIDLENMYLHKLFDGYADRTRKQRMLQAEDNIQEINSKIAQRLEIIGNLYGELEEARLKLNSLRALGQQKDDSLYEFFRAHKNARAYCIGSDNTVYYDIIDTLDFYDENEADTLFRNNTSWVYNYVTKESAEFLRELLVEKRGIIRITARFKLTGMAMVNSVRAEFLDTCNAMPNPHIYFYGCNGANDQYYAQFARTGDWELAIEQSIAATKNWNVGDSTVGKSMFRYICENDHQPFIYVTDGSKNTEMTEGMKLVSFDEFKNIVKARRDAEAQAENKEGEANE